MGDAIGIPQNSVCKRLSVIGAEFYISCRTHKGMNVPGVLLRV